ncbi:MAG: hypothetical protein DLM63_09085 [Solirubrobacterales bacterium]|nr:MAG: hypothetical protein DLM63_09085 [Solirubrobacterales bacterium]
MRGHDWSRTVAPSAPSATIKLTDALIAATAVEHGLPIITQDDDYDPIAHAHLALHVVKV